MPLAIKPELRESSTRCRSADVTVRRTATLADAEHLDPLAERLLAMSPGLDIVVTQFVSEARALLAVHVVEIVETAAAGRTSEPLFHSPPQPE